MVVSLYVAMASTGTLGKRSVVLCVAETGHFGFQLLNVLPVDDMDSTNYRHSLAGSIRQQSLLADSIFLGPLGWKSDGFFELHPLEHQGQWQMLHDWLGRSSIHSSPQNIR